MQSAAYVSVKAESGMVQMIRFNGEWRAVKLSSTVHCRISGKFYALYSSNK